MQHSTLTSPETISIESVSYLINEKGIAPAIAYLDLEMIKMKIMDEDEGLGWTREQCEMAEVEYKRFLHLNKKFPDFTIVPNKTMDVMWHQHILDTRAYHKDCEIVFGKYFHHFPYFGMRSESDKQDLIDCFEETKNIYATEFNDSMFKDSASHCNSSCNSSGKCSSR